jgi:hypothetical protein
MEKRDYIKWWLDLTGKNNAAFYRIISPNIGNLPLPLKDNLPDA